MRFFLYLCNRENKVMNMRPNDQLASAYLALCRAWARGESAIPPPPFEQFIGELKRMSTKNFNKSRELIKKP